MQLTTRRTARGGGCPAWVIPARLSRLGELLVVGDSTRTRRPPRDQFAACLELPRRRGHALLVPGRRRHEQVKQRCVGLETLSVPLNAEYEPPVGALDRLDRAVRRPGRRHQVLAELPDGLVMEGVDLEPWPEGGTQPAARRGLDLMRGDAAVLGLTMREPITHD